MTRAVVALVSDLIFATKIKSTAEAAGVDVQVVATLEALSERLDGRPDALVLIDLDGSGLDPVEAIALCRRRDPPPRTIAFGPHVRSDLFAAAHRAGAGEVLARSAFVKRLPAILTSDVGTETG